MASTSDLPSPRPAIPVGIHRLSTLIASDPELSIYRSFTALNNRNILYLQTELTWLEARLLKLDAKANKETQLDVWSLPRCWLNMRKAGMSENQENADMWNTVLEIRRVLEAYNQALQAQVCLHSLKRPVPRSLDALVNLTRNPHLISRLGAEYTDLRHREDLVSLAPKGRNEKLSEFLDNHFYKYFQSQEDRNRSSSDSPLGYYSESRIRSTVRVLAIVISSVFPILPIVVLSFIHSYRVRLGLVVVFSVLCSTALALVTNATNSEIIGITAGYAAIQVVFVSGNITSS